MLQFITAAESLFVSVHQGIRRLRMTALCSATPRNRCRLDPVACTRTLLVRVLMGTQTFPTSLGTRTKVDGQCSLVRSSVQMFRVPFNQRSSLVREVRASAKFVRPRSSFVQFGAHPSFALLEHRSGLALASLDGQ